MLRRSGLAVLIVAALGRSAGEQHAAAPADQSPSDPQDPLTTLFLAKTWPAVDRLRRCLRSSSVGDFASVEERLRAHKGTF